MFNIDDIRNDFPFIKKNADLVYFDNGATTLKPKTVIDRVNDYNAFESVNPHTTDYNLVYRINLEIEDVRDKVAHFINANSKNEIIFTSGATHSSNLLALSYGMNNINEGDVILTTLVEHASNTLPWFNVAKKRKAKIEYIELNNDGTFNLNNYIDCFNKFNNIKVVVICETSNVLSLDYPIKDISKIAHEHNAIVICDSCQSIQHNRIDVIDNDVDFCFFSAHKIIGPTGIGVLYGKYHLLEKLDPLFYGGGSNARYDKDLNVILKDIPERFESGTVNVSSILGFGCAIDYINNIGIDNIRKYEDELNKYLFSELSKLNNIIIVNNSSKNSTISFVVKDIFAQDAANYLGNKGIAIRSGNHCAKLLHNITGYDDVIRASLFFYNTKEEIDKLVNVLKDITLEKVIGDIV